MDVGIARQRFGIDLHRRSKEHEVQVRTHRGDRADQITIEPLIDHSEKTDPRTRNRSLVGRVSAERAGTREMIDVDAAGKEMNVGMGVFLRFVKAVAAGKDDSGTAEEPALGRSQTRRSSGEIREFIHAVVDDCRSFEMVAESKRHRGVVPEDIESDMFGRD